MATEYKTPAQAHQLSDEHTRASEATIQAMVDSSTDIAIIATDPQGLITVFNKGAERLLGYRANEMVGKQTPEVFHLKTELVARGEALREEGGVRLQGFDVFTYTARQGRQETRRWTYVKKNGEHCTVSLSVSALKDDHSNVIGYLGMAVDASPQLAAEETARLATQHFAGAFNSSAVGMALVSLQGRWLEVNEALCKMLGYSESELLQSDFQTLTHPDDLQSDLAFLQQLLSDAIPNYEMQKRYYRKDGELIRARLWVALVRDSHGAPLHLVAQIQDITDEYLARRKLHDSEARLRGLFQLSPIGISLRDFKDGKMLDANAALIAPSGYTQEEFMLLTDRELTPVEHHPAFYKAVEQLRDEGRYGPFEKEYIRKDGSRYPIITQGLLMKETSGREVVWSLIEDISERKRLERIQNDFVSTVSHELRTPLTSIAGALSLAGSGVLGELNPDLQEMLQIAAKSTERLSHLVNDLLDMEKLAAGKMPLTMREVALQPLLDAVIKSMQVFAMPQQVEIVSGDALDVIVTTDSFRLEQVLTNLLSNACKNSKTGGRVELHAKAGPQQSVTISVVDYGHGIPAHFRSQIFHKFAQADASDASTRKGTGLGLAISKELVEKMGGSIGFESEEGKGSHFWVQIPQERTL